ncbi:MAG: oligosaccharide flippase family protein [Bacteroidales bacterium]|nr:oligosaccharide flippase family protein [Bacteroidales bacterium]
MAPKSFLKDLTGVFSSNIFIILAGLLVSVILTRKLGPGGFGIYSAILVIPLLVVSFAQLGIRGSSIYHVGKKQFSPRDIVAGILLILVMTSVLGIIITGAGFLFLDDENYSRLYIVLVLLMIPFRLAMAYFGGIFIGNEQIGKSNFMNWFSEVIHLIAVIAFVWLLEWQIAGALLALLISHVLIAGWALFNLHKEFKLHMRFQPQVIRSLLSMGFLFALSFVVIQLNFRIDILLLRELSSLEEVGYYSLGVSIAEKLWQLPFAIGIVLMSRTANATDQEAINKTTAKLVRVSFVAGLLASVAMIAVSPWVVPAIWGEQFRPSILVIQSILPGILFISVFRVLSSRLSGIGKPQVSIYVFLPALVINVLLNLLWIPDYGAFGAVLATNVSYTLGTLAYIFVYSRIVKMPVLKIFAFQKSDFEFLKEMRKWIKR